ncbi:MAG: MFS transporter [Promethearchaeota archaeon]
MSSSEEKSERSERSEFEHDPVSTKELIGYNMGAVPGAFFGGFMGQIQAFYFKWLQLDVGWIVIGQIIYAIWNVINDPIFGVLQDRTKTKQGRYIPWIKYSAPLFTISFILIFFPPQSWNGLPTSPVQVTLFAWYLITQIVYDTFFTIVYLAHVALLPQMTMASKERTKVAAVYGLLSLIGGVASGGLPIIFLQGAATSEKLLSFQFFVVIFGLCALIPWIFVVKWVKERQEYLPEHNVPFKQAAGAIFRIKGKWNGPGLSYVIYDGVSVGILNIILSGLTFMLDWLLGQYSGNPNPTWTNMLYLIGPLVGALFGVIVQLRIPKKRDIRTAILFGLICQAIGFFIAFLGSFPSPSSPPDEYRLPANLLLLSFGLGIGFFGIVTDFLYHNPMRSDVIDYDEAMTGERSESVYAGVGCIFSKPMISFALLIVPVVMGMFGLNPPDGLTTTGYSVTGTYGDALIGVGIATLLIPSILATIGAVAWYFYPLNRKKLDDLHVILEKMHEKKRSERLKDDGTSKFVEDKKKGNG